MQAAAGDDRAGFNELSPKNKFLYLCSDGVVWVICTGCVFFSSVSELTNRLVLSAVGIMRVERPAGR